jgi:proline dehydrogenase
MDPLDLATEIERYLATSSLNHWDDIKFLIEALYEEGSE